MSTSGASNTHKSSSAPLILKSKACNACKIRKVKCDKAWPCLNCERWSLDCAYPSPMRSCQRARRKPVPTDSQNDDANVSRQDLNTLIQRIEKLESSLNGPTCDRITPLPQTVLTEHQEHTTIATLSQRLHCLESQLDQSQSTLIPPDGVGTADNVQILQTNFDFTPTLTTSVWSIPNYDIFTPDISHLKLKKPQLEACWQVYQNYLDPVLKVVHKTTVEDIFQRVDYAITPLKLSEMALLLTIYFSSVLIMSESNIQLLFGCTKLTIVTTYSLAAQYCLMQLERIADGYQDIVAMQALALLVTVNVKINKLKQDRELVAIETLLAHNIVNTSQAFQQEMKNRIAWHIWYLRHRSAQTQAHIATPQQPVLYEMPLNLNDFEIGPKMLNYPESRFGWTDMSFALIRFELAQLSKQLDLDMDISQRYMVIERCESSIRTRYLNYCDMASPMAWLAQHITFVHLSEMRFKLRDEERIITTGYIDHVRSFRHENILLAAIDIMDLPKRLRTEPQSAHWTWLLRAFHQFLPLKFLLAELCVIDSANFVVNHAWEVATGSFDRWSYENSNSDNFSILTQLLEQATSRRMTLLKNQDLQSSMLNTSYVNTESMYSRRIQPLELECQDNCHLSYNSGN